MKKNPIILVLAMGALASLCAYAQNPRSAPPPRPARHATPPPSQVRPAPPPPRPMRHAPPPPRGLACLAGAVICAATHTPDVVVVRSCPQTVIVQNTAQSVGRESFKDDLAAELARRLQNIPFTVAVENFYVSGLQYGASVNVTVSVNGNGYAIAAGGARAGYAALRNYLTDEIVGAVNRLLADTANQTTVRKIS